MQLSEQLLRYFEQDGYLFFPGTFDADEVFVLRRAATELYAPGREQAWRERSGVARSVFAAHTCNKAFRRPGSHRDFSPIEPLADDTPASLSA